MKIRMLGSIALLEGDWTLAGVTQSNIDSLAVALQQLESDDAKSLHIDCRDVSAIDADGLHLLSGWAQCARLHGVEPELIISQNELQQTFQNLGFCCRYTSTILGEQKNNVSILQNQKITV